jgi:DNA recombination protein RmuC
MTEIIFAVIILILLVVQIVLSVIFRHGKQNDTPDAVLEKLSAFEKQLARNETAIREEFGRNREETGKTAKESREELNTVFVNFTGLVDNKIKSLIDLFDNSSKTNREELNKSLKTFEESFSRNVDSFNRILKEKFGELIQKQEKLTLDTNSIFEKNRETIEKKLTDIQTDNALKLEKMRETVDEKLHKTLETRLGESFRLVSDRLELVQKGLGEMQNLATGVGDLKKVLSNVKTKGVLGEYQLGGILEQTLSPNQYAQNVKTKEGSRDNVEYAIKIPGKDDSTKIIWLPIDAKFPSVDYENLNDAYDSGNVEDIEKRKSELANKIKLFAKMIKDKYVDPPATTEFAIMFLPFEGLYAEVLRIPNLFETIQREYKITITGPTTISAFLNSLQMGFRSLAVEKRTSEIWDLLGAVRAEFGKFGDVLQKTKEKLDSASKEIENAGTRSRAIERKLRDVQTLPESKAKKLLGDINLPDDESSNHHFEKDMD